MLSCPTATLIYWILDKFGLMYYLELIRPAQLQVVWLMFTSAGSSIFCILLYRYFKSR